MSLLEEQGFSLMQIKLRQVWTGNINTDNIFNHDELGSRWHTQWISLPFNATYLKFHDFSKLLITIMRVKFFFEFRTIFHEIF